LAIYLYFGPLDEREFPGVAAVYLREFLKPRMKKKAGALIFTILVCLLLLEIGLRIIGRQPTNMADGIAVQNGDSYKNKANITKALRFPAFSYTVFTNEYGFRDKAVGVPELKGKPFDVFMGASDVFGNGVEYDDTFVGIFAAAASKKGRNVLNLAIGGHFLLDQEALLKEFMETTKQKPTRVFFAVNALTIPGFDKRNRDVIVKSGYLIDRKGWRIAYLRLLAGNTSSAFCFFRNAIRRIQERYLKFELKVSASEFLKIYSKSNQIRHPERIRKYEEYLYRFEEFCQLNDIEVIYVYLPLSDSFNLRKYLDQIRADPNGYDTEFYEDLMRSHCEKKGVKLANPRPNLQRYFEEGNELRYKLDPHFNKPSNRIIGEYLVEGFL
jgi:hypothetical protein